MTEQLQMLYYLTCNVAAEFWFTSPLSLGRSQNPAVASHGPHWWWDFDPSTVNGKTLRGSGFHLILIHLPLLWDLPGYILIPFSSSLTQGYNATLKYQTQKPRWRCPKQNLSANKEHCEPCEGLNEFIPTVTKTMQSFSCHRKILRERVLWTPGEIISKINQIFLK